LKDLIAGKSEPMPTQETDIGVGKKRIEVELPAPPSGDDEEALADWCRSVNVKIVEAVPRGYNLKSSEVKEVVRHVAEIVVEKS